MLAVIDIVCEGYRCTHMLTVYHVSRWDDADQRLILVVSLLPLRKVSAVLDPTPLSLAASSSPPGFSAVSLSWEWSQTT